MTITTYAVHRGDSHIHTYPSLGLARRGALAAKQWRVVDADSNTLATSFSAAEAEDIAANTRAAGHYARVVNGERVRVYRIDRTEV